MSNPPNEIKEMALAMYLQVRWCRGQLIADGSRVAQSLFFTLENPERDTWQFRDLTIDPSADKFKQFQAEMWRSNALGIIEFYDTKTHYVAHVYNFTGIVITFKSTLNSALRSFKRSTLETCQDNVKPKELSISEEHKAPKGWDQTFRALFSKKAGLDH